jgi:hypothetical protein
MYSEEEFYFYDERKKELVKNCPSCRADFIIDQGAACTLACDEKQLEIKHRKISVEIVEYYLSKVTISPGNT